jgi:hypothetical protein
MAFKQYLADEAKDHMALPMLPVFWEDVFALRMSLTKILLTKPPISPQLLNVASSALENPAQENLQKCDSSIVTASKALQGLQLDSSKESASPPTSERSATPKGNDASSEANSSL